MIGKPVFDALIGLPAKLPSAAHLLSVYHPLDSPVYRRLITGKPLAARIPDSRQRRWGDYGPLPRRKRNVAAALEPDLYLRFQQHLQSIGKSASHYITQLIEQDLNNSTNNYPF